MINNLDTSNLVKHISVWKKIVTQTCAVGKRRENKSFINRNVTKWSKTSSFAYQCSYKSSIRVTMTGNNNVYKTIWENGNKEYNEKYMCCFFKSNFIPYICLFCHQQTHTVISIFFSCTMHYTFQRLFLYCTFHVSLSF